MTAPAATAGLRLTWVQPEDLVGHELRQAAQDGRDPAAVASVARRWLAAGGRPAPERAGASPGPADPGRRGRVRRPALLHISEPTRQAEISFARFFL